MCDVLKPPSNPVVYTEVLHYMCDIHYMCERVDVCACLEGYGWAISGKLANARACIPIIRDKRAFGLY